MLNDFILIFVTLKDKPRKLALNSVGKRFLFQNLPEVGFTSTAIYCYVLNFIADFSANIFKICFLHEGVTYKTTFNKIRENMMSGALQKFGISP